MNLLRGQTVDELFGNIASIISDGDEAVRFREIFNRDQLLHAFGKGDTQIALGYHRKVESGESHWIKTYLNMLRNPGSGDVEAIVYSLDMDRQEKEEKVISAITNREYDYIALINAETQAIHYQYTSEKAVATVHLTMGNYDTVMTYIASEQENPAETRECLAKIDTSSKFLLGLVNDILDMTKAESGKIELRTEPYVFKDFITYLDAVIRPQCEVKNLKFKIDADAAPDKAIVADPLRINQIFFNLLSNAVKFTPEGGEILYRQREIMLENGKIRLESEVIDNGSGMSEEFQKHLFEPFTQESRHDTA